jgi:hypothetical protein
VNYLDHAVIESAKDKLSPKQKTDETKLLDMLYFQLNSPFFYFSYSFDLSRTYAHHLKTQGSSRAKATIVKKK